MVLLSSERHEGIWSQASILPLNQPFGQGVKKQCGFINKLFTQYHNLFTFLSYTDLKPDNFLSLHSRDKGNR